MMDKQVALNKMEQLIKLIQEMNSTSSAVAIMEAYALAIQIRAQIRKA